VPTRLVQKILREIKKRERTRIRRQDEQRRVSVRVLAKRAIWTQDAASLGRAAGFEVQVIKDRGTQEIVALETMPVAKAGEIIALFEHLKKDRGLPLVWMTDNGSAYCADEVQRYLARQQVVHLRSLPRTPRHNGAVEREIRDLRVLLDRTSSRAGLQEHRAALNSRLRATNCFKSAREMDEQMSDHYTEEIRGEFYRECVSAARNASAESGTWRRKRLIERESIFRQLEKFGLIERTTGNQIGLA
jgi:transposase InsO family protein